MIPNSVSLFLERGVGLFIFCALHLRLSYYAADRMFFYLITIFHILVFYIYRLASTQLMSVSRLQGTCGLTPVTSTCTSQIMRELVFCVCKKCRKRLLSVDFCIYIFLFWSWTPSFPLVSVEEVKTFKMQFGDIDERLRKMCFVCLSDLDYRLVLHIWRHSSQSFFFFFYLKWS